MDQIDSGLCLRAGFGFKGAEPSDYATTLTVITALRYSCLLKSRTNFQTRIFSTRGTRFIRYVPLVHNLHLHMRQKKKS